MRAKLALKFREHVISEGLSRILSERAAGMFFNSVKNVSHGCYNNVSVQFSINLGTSRLCVNVGIVGILLDELTARRHIITHKH